MPKLEVVIQYDKRKQIKRLAIFSDLLPALNSRSEGVLMVYKNI